MYERKVNAPDDSSFFLFGPRGTGKTTWVKRNYPDALYLDLLNAAVYNDLNAMPSRMEGLINAHTEWVVIDEVQRIPELLNEVHRLIESTHCKFILTGSSARKLRRQGTNLLAGRALLCHMYPLTASELGDDFDLGRSLRYGHLPRVFQMDEPAAYLDAYVKNYLVEEVLQEGLTRNIAAFSRFLEMAAFSQGGMLNISAVARDCMVERKVVESYFAILEDLLVAERIPAFSRKATRRVVRHPKFFLFDAGVYGRIRPRGPLDTAEELEGSGLETLVYQDMRAVNDGYGYGYSFSYWRTSNGQEVDFVLYGEKGFFGIEVKRSTRYRKSDCAGLAAFHREYPQARCILVYGGETRMWPDFVEVIPLKEFLTTLPQVMAEGSAGNTAGR